MPTGNAATGGMKSASSGCVNGPFASCHNGSSNGTDEDADLE